MRGCINIRTEQGKRDGEEDGGRGISGIVGARIAGQAKEVALQSGN